MKDLSLLTWLTQLGLSVAFPLGGLIMLAVWLREKFSLGSWVLWVGIGLGLLLALDGLRKNLKALSRLSNKRDREPPAVSFNEHD